MKKVSLRSLYKTIGKHIGEPFIITSRNKDVAIVQPLDKETVVLDSRQLENLEKDNRVAFTFNGQVFIALPLEKVDELYKDKEF
jgi:hypothetical protein